MTEYLYNNFTMPLFGSYFNNFNSTAGVCLWGNPFSGNFFNNNFYNPFANLFGNNLFNDYTNNFNTGINFTMPIFNPTFSLAETNIFGFLNNNTTSKSFNTKTTLKDYDAGKAQKLAREIARIKTGFDGQCAAHVKDAIENAGLGSYQPGDAHELASILSKNKNFKEISTSGLDLETLPAGCILVYDKGVAGYSSKYGHTEITLGDGTAASGGITQNIRDGARVFIPV